MIDTTTSTQRILGLAEGISLLVLFGIAMPLKYLFDEPLAVKIVGMLHGVLFIVYVLHSIIAKSKLGWSFKVLAYALVASIVPFGTIAFERRYLKKQL